MASPFSTRAALCTLAVMFGFGALATGDAGTWLRGSGDFSGRPASALVDDEERGARIASPEDCGDVGRRGDGFRFVTGCEGEAASPGRRMAVIKTADGVRLVGRGGVGLDLIPSLTDGRSFTIFWSPAGDWSFANHGYSGRERLRVFQVVNSTAIERSAVFAEATAATLARFPCLAGRGDVAAAGAGWSPDGSRILLRTAATRPDACPDSPPEPLWMIGETVSGRIDPASVRPAGSEPPSDGPYEAF